VTEKTLSDVLDRFAAVVQSVMDAGAPVNNRGKCALCLVEVERHDHDPDCGWQIAHNQVSQSDVNEVRRLARVLRYNGRAS
jgi:hypothetical protein